MAAYSNNFKINTILCNMFIHWCKTTFATLVCSSFRKPVAICQIILWITKVKCSFQHYFHSDSWVNMPLDLWNGLKLNVHKNKTINLNVLWSNFKVLISLSVYCHESFKPLYNFHITYMEKPLIFKKINWTVFTSYLLYSFCFTDKVIL